MDRQFLRKQRSVGPDTIRGLVGAGPHRELRIIGFFGSDCRGAKHPAGLGGGSLGRRVGGPRQPPQIGDWNPVLHGRHRHFVCPARIFGQGGMVACLPLRPDKRCLPLSQSAPQAGFDRQHGSSGSVDQRLCDQCPHHYRNENYRAVPRRGAHCHPGVCLELHLGRDLLLLRCAVLDSHEDSLLPGGVFCHHP